MVPINSQIPGTTATSSPGNGELNFIQLQKECEQLRQSLAAVEKERDEYRSMFYAYMRATVTDEDKADLERCVRDVTENGGVPFRELLNQHRQSRGS
jgi:hypothetical protein